MPPFAWTMQKANWPLEEVSGSKGRPDLLKIEHYRLRPRKFASAGGKRQKAEFLGAARKACSQQMAHPRRISSVPAKRSASRDHEKSKRLSTLRSRIRAPPCGDDASGDPVDAVEMLCTARYFIMAEGLLPPRCRRSTTSRCWWSIPACRPRRSGPLQWMRPGASQ